MNVTTAAVLRRPSVSLRRSNARKMWVIYHMSVDFSTASFTLIWMSVTKLWVCYGWWQIYQPSILWFLSELYMTSVWIQLHSCQLSCFWHNFPTFWCFPDIPIRSCKILLFFQWHATHIITCIHQHSWLTVVMRSASHYRWGPWGLWVELFVNSSVSWWFL